MANVKKALKWQMRKVVGAVITHEHNENGRYGGALTLDMPSRSHAIGGLSIMMADYIRYSNCTGALRVSLM